LSPEGSKKKIISSHPEKAFSGWKLIGNSLKKLGIEKIIARL